MRTAKLTFRVSADRLKEWREWVESVQPTTQNPLPGERILQAARTAFELQERRREYQRDYYRENYIQTRGKGVVRRKHRRKR